MCFCKKLPESIIHFFCDCIIVQPIWEGLVTVIKNNYDIDFSISSFDKIFGIQDDNFLTYLILCVKYYLYLCKFQDKIPNFTNFIIFIKSNRENEYYIAKKKKRGKLSFHYKKWRFDI